MLSHSPADTIAIARQFATQLRGGEFLALRGELGAGKTQFVKGLALGLGIKAAITSPTFVLLKQYPFRRPQDPQHMTLNHLDLYRTQGAVEAIGMGFDDLISATQITIVEWSERIPDMLPVHTQTIELRYLDDQTRELIFD